jgi:exodeoxyribonuclease-3
VKLASWNVNGIRAAARKDFIPWMDSVGADLVCIQESKATKAQLTEDLLHPLGYHSYWNSAEKAGYSGVAIYSKKEPLRIQNGLGFPELDTEGRVITLEFPDFVLVNSYFPNSQRDHARLGFKLKFCNQMFSYLEALRSQQKNVVICGDFNIAHRPIDLRNPKANEDNAGFLPEERAWMDEFLSRGYVDGFRKFNPGPDQYTWWSYRPGVREKNIGWRLDYFVVDQEMSSRLKSVDHQSKVMGSDHCPVVMELL